MEVVSVFTNQLFMRACIYALSVTGCESERTRRYRKEEH